MSNRKTTRPKPAPGRSGPRSTGRLQKVIDDAVRKEIAAALDETGGNVSRAAVALGISRDSLIKRLRGLGIDAATHRR
jgi:transcriptional regulator of acetoin/glycerol metabolism